MLILVLNQKESACLLSSDFRSENPPTQTRTFHTRKRYLQYGTTLWKNNKRMELELFILFTLGGAFLLTFLLQLYLFVGEQRLWFDAYNRNWKRWWQNRNFWT
jgi:hypothetical protein